MRRNPCPAFLGRPPGVPGQPGGLGLELRVQSPRLLCVITEDIPVEQEEHGPETCHLVTFISAASAFTDRVSLMRWKEQGHWKEADLNLNPGTSPWAVGLPGGFSLSLCFLTCKRRRLHYTFSGCCVGGFSATMHESAQWTVDG